MSILNFRGLLTCRYFMLNYPGNTASVIVSRKMNKDLCVIQMGFQHRTKFGKGRGASAFFSFRYMPTATAILGTPVPVNPEAWRRQHLCMTARLSKKVFSRTKERITMEEIKNVKLGKMQ